MEAKAVAKYVRIAPRKLRIVKYLCDGGSDSDRCADRNTDVCFYGDVLSETDL